MFGGFRTRELCGAGEPDDHDEGYGQPEEKDAYDVIHGELAAALTSNTGGKKRKADADPQCQNARHPQANKNSVIAVNQEPECDAGQEADYGRKKKRIIDFSKHMSKHCLIYFTSLSNVCLMYLMVGDGPNV